MTIYVLILHLQVSSELITVPKWLPLAALHPVDYYTTYTKNCTGSFTEEEVRRIRAFYYAMCAEADALLGWLTAVVHQGLAGGGGLDSYL